jgi:ribonuclease HI
MTITAAADGSALGNPGPAGWAWVIDDARWRAGGWSRATNNQGELMAVLDLLRSTAHVPDTPLHILCDSQYVINSVTKWMPGWKRKGWRKSDGKPVLNLELLKELDVELLGRTVTFEWVKGHAGHSLNEAADARAREAATEFQRKRVPNEGPGFPGGPRTTSSPTLLLAPAAPPTLFDSRDIAPQDPAASAIDEAVLPLIELLGGLERADLRCHSASLRHAEFASFGWPLANLTELANTIESISATELSPGIAQLLSQTSTPAGTELLSSIWLRAGANWQVRFRQFSRGE